MKIYQINVVCGNGSTGRIATDIAYHLKKQGDNCRIAYGRGTAPSDLDSLLIESKIGVMYHALMARITDKQGLYSQRATKKLIVNIKDYDPDIIHLHNIHGYYLNYKILFEFLKEYHRPVIWTFHDCWAFTGHCAHYDYVKCQKWKNGCEHCVQKGEYPKSCIIDASHENYKLKCELFTMIGRLTIVAPSKWLANEIKQSFFREAHVRICQNGIDLDNFKPYKNNYFRKELKGKYIILGVASVWNQRKGLEHYIKLSEMLTYEFCIVLVGLGDKQIRELSNYKKIMGIVKTGNVEKLARIYSSAHVFLNLTLEDTFPTVNLEALACGTPVLTYETGGSSECVIEGNCGDCIEKGNIKAIADYLLNKNFLKYDSESCRKKAAEFSKKECYKEYVRLYREVLQ